jgi:hypothetical protein
MLIKKADPCGVGSLALYNHEKNADGGLPKKRGGGKKPAIYDKWLV